MNDPSYSNREIDTMMKGVHEKLDLIIVQTTRTNGRVSSLEAWRNRIVGAVAVIMVIGLPILGYLALQVESLSSNQATASASGGGIDSAAVKNVQTPK